MCASECRTFVGRVEASVSTPMARTSASASADLRKTKRERAHVSVYNITNVVILTITLTRSCSS